MRNVFEPLFPSDRAFFTLAARDSEGFVLPWQQSAHECQRCGAIVSNRLTHHAWHGSVDSNTTTKLAVSDA
jgi:hypothetical protein